MPKTIFQEQTIEDSLLGIPFFKGLPRHALKAIASKLRRVELEKGAVVFTENSLGDSMYLIESGQVKVSVTAEDSQKEKIINYLGPGNFFGEMALLLNQRRTATVTVTIDAELLVLHKKDFDELLAEYPEISLQITRELSRRLSDVVTEIKRRPGYALTAVIGDEAWRLAEEVHRLTRQRVVLYNITGKSLADRVKSAFQQDSLAVLEDHPDLTSDDLVDMLSNLMEQYDWVLVGVPETYSEVNAKALRLARALAVFPGHTPEWVGEAFEGPVFPCDGSDEAVGRIARKITARVVGLALSSGGARGIAHVGVLQTLIEAGIPIDMVAGTSAGSLFGGLYVCGKTPAEIADFARNLPRLISLKSGLWDPKFKRPWDGLIKGDRTRRFLDRQFNHATFADTRIPFYVVAADVMAGEEVVFESGPLADAVRASIGIIGIFSPYRLNGRYLIDGGAVNPVPASVLAEKGANIIIASSVIPSLEEERLRGQTSIYRQMKPLNFLGVLSNMMSIMEREIVKTRMTDVDVLIKPQVGLFTAMDYERADAFIKLGQEAAAQQVEKIQALILSGSD